MRRHLIAELGMVLALAEAIALSPSALAYEVGAVESGGVVKGRVVFKGGEVPMKTVVPTKNQDVCGSIRQDPLVDIGTDGGVKEAVALLKGVAKGKPWGKPAMPPKINNEKCIFQPHVQVVPLGSDFTIYNSDPILHNTHGFHGKKTVFNVALPFKDAQVQKKLDKPGLVRVECDVHGWMQGWAYVADNPYYTLSGEDGSFTISDVPPGDYTMLVWQEHGGEMEKRVSVKAGETVDIGTIEIK